VWPPIRLLTPHTGGAARPACKDARSLHPCPVAPEGSVMRSHSLQVMAFICPARWRALLICLCALWPGQAMAERLSIRHYGISEGLTNNRVIAIHQAAKGYLWFATYEGLNRFDGYRFTNYNTRDGLGHSLINDIVEDSSGHLWVATNGG